MEDIRLYIGLNVDSFEWSYAYQDHTSFTYGDYNGTGLKFSQSIRIRSENKVIKERK